MDPRYWSAVSHRSSEEQLFRFRRAFRLTELTAAFTRASQREHGHSSRKRAAQGAPAKCQKSVLREG
jgi:hypothetical protein